MFARLKSRLSLIWFVAGLAIGVVVFAFAIPAIGAAFAPQPAATYLSSALSEDEVEELMQLDGVPMPERVEATARIITGPDGTIVALSEPQFGQTCLLYRRDAGLDYIGCAPTGWPIVFTVPVRTFGVDRAVVEATEDSGGAALTLVYADERLTVWPVRPESGGQGE